MPRRINVMPHDKAARAALRYADSFIYDETTVAWIDVYMKRYRWYTGRPPEAGPQS